MAMSYPRLAVFGGAVGALAVMTVLSAALGFALPAFLPKTYTHYASAVCKKTTKMSSIVVDVVARQAVCCVAIDLAGADFVCNFSAVAPMHGRQSVVPRLPAGTAKIRRGDASASASLEYLSGPLSLSDPAARAKQTNEPLPPDSVPAVSVCMCVCVLLCCVFLPRRGK